jgi:hypothetical protein
MNGLTNKLNLVLFKDSTILKTPEFCNRMIKFFDKKIKSTELLYRATRDSFNVYSFHKKCDYKLDTVTIIETTK